MEYPIIEEIKNSKFFKKYGRKTSWVSGSSTYVYPIELYVDEKRIDIQIDSLVNQNGITNSFMALYKKLRIPYNLKCWWIYKSDGSCPKVYTIWYK